jgi:glycosyltransferase involved in cell wall biosynthesis
MTAKSDSLPLAAVILARNEELNISACIESVRDRVESVYLVNNGSTDKTVALAEMAGATVLHHRIHGRFLITDQRNWAIQNVTSSSGWVLFLDADERATPAFLDAIGHRLRESGDSVDGIYLCPKFMYQGTWLRRFMGFPNWHPRLIHRDRASYEGGVWEDFAGKPRTANVDEPYLHLVNSKGLANWMERHMPYAEDEAELMLSTEQPSRRALLRGLARRSGWARPVAALGYHLVLRRGIIDGGSVWSYARRQLIYQLLILEAKREELRDRANLPR